MEKNYQTFIGIDVSKDKLDFCIITANTSSKPLFGIIDNKAKSIEKFIISIKKNYTSVLFCLENTGIYGMPLCYRLQAAEQNYAVVPALEIKRSKGICRGKSDKIDAKNIASFALLHQHQLTLSVLPENDFIELRLLLTEREKLLKAIGAFHTTSENKNFLPQEVLQSLMKHNHKTIVMLEKQLEAVDKLTDELIKKNETFNRQNTLLQSIPGIGKQTAVMFIAFTQAFTLFDNARQFACYAGVAPFEYSSGSSIKGRTKVSPLANKKLKSILNMAALSAKKYDTQMKQYFERKVKEGKNKMLVLNAVRCKIVSRAFAVIRRGTPYVNIQKFAA